MFGRRQIRASVGRRACDALPRGGLDLTALYLVFVLGFVLHWWLTADE